ncbi:MAG: LPS export ABC transporter permease LptF [Deltaproteobacteria bacterium]|jgi:lipopolysaccharide export system permease protein|nr:LPS export ABC transporter permease LptF [Deltaproteobacteria bacterium]
MKSNSIINRYLLKEMMLPFVINLVFFTFIFLMTKILDITNLIVNYKISMFSVLLILLYSVPRFLSFVIPMSVMMAVLLTFIRLSNDKELVALKAGGVSIYGLMPPVLVFCVIGVVLSVLITLYGMPWGKVSIRELTFQVAASHVDAGLKERTFNDSFKDVMLYINKIDLKKKILRDVFIEDKRSQNIVSTIMAPKGRMFADPDKLAFHLKLYQGTINQVNLGNRSAHSINFDSYDVNLDFKKPLTASNGGPKDEDEMHFGDLREYLKTFPKKNAQYYSALIELHKKFSIPFACLALGRLAVPLGIQSESAKRSTGLGLGMIFFLIYYVMLSAGSVFGEAGVYPPMIGMWVPNIALGSLGLFLLTKTANDRAVKIMSFFNFFKKKFKPLLKKHKNDE